MKIVCALLLTVLLGILPLSGADSARIAVVDMSKLFRSYYKTLAVESVLKEQTRVALEYRKTLTDELQKMEEQFLQLADRTKNLAITEEEREKAAKEAEQLAVQIRKKRSDIDRYNQEKGSAIQKISQEKRDAILKEIREEVIRHAQANKYRYVFDSSARSADNVPVLLMYPPGSDITQSVLESLNRGQKIQK